MYTIHWSDIYGNQSCSSDYPFDDLRDVIAYADSLFNNCRYICAIAVYDQDFLCYQTGEESIETILSVPANFPKL